MPPIKIWGIIKSDRQSVRSFVCPLVCPFEKKGMPFKLYIYLGDPILVELKMNKKWITPFCVK